MFVQTSHSRDISYTVGINVYLIQYNVQVCSFCSLWEYNKRDNLFIKLVVSINLLFTSTLISVYMCTGQMKIRNVSQATHDTNFHWAIRPHKRF